MEVTLKWPIGSILSFAFISRATVLINPINTFVANTELYQACIDLFSSSQRTIRCIVNGMTHFLPNLNDVVDLIRFLSEVRFGTISSNIFHV